MKNLTKELAVKLEKFDLSKATVLHFQMKGGC